MSAAIGYALDMICGRGAIDIPESILKIAFRDEWLDSKAPVTLESRILQWVIKERVIRDMNLVQGEEVQVPLDDLSPYITDDYVVVYTIPPERTNYREILSVSHVSYIPYGSNIGWRGNEGLSRPTWGGNDLMTAANQVFDSVSSMPYIQTAKVDIVGQNTIRITDRNRRQQSYMLTCYVANDGYLNNITPHAYPLFAEVCLLAVKAWIYRRMVTEIGEFFLQRGKEMGIVKDIIMDWKDAAAEYKLKIDTEWRAVASTLNERQHMEDLSIQFGLGI